MTLLMQITRTQKEFKKRNKGIIITYMFKVIYYNLYVQSDILLLADIFENFQTICLRIYELFPAHFLSASGLA